MVLVPEAYRNHPDLQKDYPEVCPTTGNFLHPVACAAASFSTFCGHGRLALLSHLR